MGSRTVKLRRLLGATALCGGMAIAGTGIGGHRGRGALGPATASARPGSLGAAPAAADLGTAASAGTSLYPVPSLLTG